MKIKFNKTACKMTIAICMLCSAGLLFLTGCTTLSARDDSLDKVYNIDEIDNPPRVIRAVMPGYPYTAAKEGVEGRVVVRMVIDSNGTAQEPEVFKAEPEGTFDEAALEAIVKYKFEPAVKDGKKVDCIVHVPIKFAMGQVDKEVYSIEYKLDEVDQPPKAVYMVPPRYPFEAQKSRTTGKVVLKFVVAPDGRAYEPEVVSSEPEGVFDEASLDALAEYRFQPAVKDGKPVPCIVRMPLKFDLSFNPPTVNE